MEKTNDKELFFSVVIPLLNEDESLPELSDKLNHELTQICQDSWEVIFVDDGSTDNSFDVLKKLNQNNNKFKIIKFRKNYGKSAALQAGFNLAQGQYIATMDADLQDDPNELPHLLTKINEGYDLVSGWKKVRHDPKLTKNIPSKLFNWATSKISGVKLHDFNCGLKLYTQEVAKSLDVYGEMHRYLPALAFIDGFKVTELPVIHHKRKYGKTKFGLSRFVNGYLDLLTVAFTSKFFNRPLHFFGLIGSLLTVVGLVIDTWLVVERLLGMTYLSNRPLAFAGMGMIVIGIQFISMGLIGEWILKSNITKKKTNYNIKETII